MLFDPSIDGPDESLRRDGVEQADTRNNGGNLVPLEVTDEVPSLAILSWAESFTNEVAASMKSSGFRPISSASR